MAMAVAQTGLAKQLIKHAELQADLDKQYRNTQRQIYAGGTTEVKLITVCT